MSLNKIVLEALEKNPVALKESLSSILSEKIANAIDKKMNESANVLDKHIASFSKKINSSSSKPTRYRSDNKVIPGMKHVEVSPDHNHQDVFDTLKSMGYYKTRGYDSKPNHFTTRHNAESMTTSSDPVHHKDGISAHFEHEHGGKMKVHFKARDLKEETLEEGIKDGYYVSNSMKVIHDKPFKDSKSAIRHADTHETKTGRVHHVTKVKDGKVEKQWAYNGGHHEGGWEHYSDYKSDDASNHLLGLHKNSMNEEVLDEEVSDYDLKRVHKDYKGYSALSTADVLKHHKAQRKISGNYTAQDAGGKIGMVASILRDKHGNKKVEAYFGLKPSQRRALDEDFDQLDELSKKTLRSYGSKAIRDSLSRRKSDPAKSQKRSDGVNLASAKLYPSQYQNSPLKAKIVAKEDFGQIDEVISKAERRNLAYHEKQAVRAAEKANVGALSRPEKEKWIDDYIAKNFIPKGAVGSAIYSGVMKVRPIKESTNESTLEDKIVAAMVAKRKKQAESEQQSKKKVSWADIAKSFDKKAEK